MKKINSSTELGRLLSPPVVFRLVAFIWLALTFFTVQVPRSNAGYSDHVHLKNTNFCLNSPYRANNGNVDVYTCNGSDADQDWSFEGNLIRLKGTSYCLNTPYRANNGNVFLWSCNSSDADQQWEWSGSNIRLKGTSYCLNTPYRYNNGNAFLWSCSGSDGDQQWEKGSPAPGPCPSSGYYCGGSVGQSAGNLYYCSGQGSNPQLNQTCTNGCQTNPPGTPDACIQGACPSSGWYCGSSVGQNANNLYTCSSSGAIPQQSEVCANGCKTNPPGTPDVCITLDFCQTVSWGGPGTYCNGNSLVTCSAGQKTITTTTCSQGCQTNAVGVPDSCIDNNACAAVTWAGAGTYCSGSRLITCNDQKQLTSEMSCANGCQINPPGVADACISSTTDFCQTVEWGGAGSYCNGNSLVYCSDSKTTTSTLACSQGCQNNAVGTPDTCIQDDFCQSVEWGGAGTYCSGSTLVTCSDAKQTVSSTTCSLGCTNNPPGVADTCTDSGFCNTVTWGGAGEYCNGSTLITCNDSRQVVYQTSCPLGCKTNIPGVADACNTNYCETISNWQGAGNYCSGKQLFSCGTGKQTLSGITCLNRCSDQGNASSCAGSSNTGVTDSTSAVFPVKEWQSTKIEPGFGYGDGPISWWPNCDGEELTGLSRDWACLVIPGVKSADSRCNNSSKKYHAALDVIYASSLGTKEVTPGNSTQQSKCEVGSGGAEVVAIADGYVMGNPVKGSEGARVTIEHPQFIYNGKSVYSVYMHLDKDSVTLVDGAHVTRGKKIGTVGYMQGPGAISVSNPHLHFELRTFADWRGGYTVSAYPSNEDYIEPCGFISSHGGDIPPSCPNVSSFGGTVTWGPVAVNFPAGAVSQPAKVSIQELLPSEVAPTAAGSVVLGQQYSITSQTTTGQAITQLAAPVSLSFAYNPTPFTIGNPVVGYYNSLSGVWESISSAVSGGIVSALTNHFSTYAVLGNQPNHPPVSKILTVPSQSGSISNTAYESSDILQYEPATGAWSKVFDGSRFGFDLNAVIRSVFVLPDGSALLTFSERTYLPDVGFVRPIDVVRFIPQSIGSNTSGTFEIYFDGSDVGLNEGFEDISAVSLHPDGRILMMVRDAFDAQGVTGDNATIYAFTPTQLGTTTAGSWSIYLPSSSLGTTAVPSTFSMLPDQSVLFSFYDDVTLPNVGVVQDVDLVRFIPQPNGSGVYEWYFDGSDVRLVKGYYDVLAVAKLSTGELVLRLGRKFRTSVGYSDEQKDLLIFTPTSIGSDVTAGTFEVWFDGSDVGLNSPTALDGVAQLPDGNLLLSITSDVSLPGIGSVGRSDLVKFVGADVNNPYGHFEAYLSAQTLGLNSATQNITALSVGANGAIYFVLDGKIYVDDLVTSANDVLKYTPSDQKLSVFLHGADVGIIGSNAAIDSLWVNEPTSDVYLSINKSATVNGLSVVDADVFVCKLTQTGIQTQCSVDKYMDSLNAGFLNNSLRDAVFIP